MNEGVSSPGYAVRTAVDGQGSMTGTATGVTCKDNEMGESQENPPLPGSGQE